MTSELQASKPEFLRCLSRAMILLVVVFGASLSEAGTVDLHVLPQIQSLVQQNWLFICGAGMVLLLIQLTIPVLSLIHQSASRLPPKSALLGSAVTSETISDKTAVDLQTLRAQTDHEARSAPVLIDDYINELIAVSRQTVAERPAAAALLVGQWLGAPHEDTLMDGPSRVGATLLILGEQAGRSITAQMSAADIEQLSGAILSVGKCEQTYLADALWRFLQEIDDANLTADPRHSFIKGVILPALVDTKSQYEISKVLAATGVYSDLELLAFFAPQSIAEVLTEEHPQIVAVALVQLEAEKAANVLAYLPPLLRKNVILRIAKMDSIAPFALEELSHIIGSNRERLERTPHPVVNGTQSAAAILTATNPDAREGILAGLQTDDPSLSAKIEAAMLDEENFTQLSSHVQHQLLGLLTVDTLSALVQGMDADLAEDWLRSMPTDLAARVKDKQRATGPVSAEKIADSRRELQRIIALMGFSDFSSNNLPNEHSITESVGVG